MQERYTKAFEWILSDRYRIWFHLLFWLVMYLDEFLALFGITSAYEMEEIPFIIIYILIDIILVYLNFYVLIPQFLLKNKLWRYAALTLLSVVIVGLLNLYIAPPIEVAPGEEPYVLGLSDFILGTFLPTLTLLGTAIAVKVFKLFLQNQQKFQEIERTSLRTELAYLKDQINPHFLFNVLNNIYVLSRKRPAEASESILLLSDMLRYQLYDCSEEKVSLKNEIDYLKNYLDLDKLRKSKAQVNFAINGHPNGIQVAPFLFLPFVENAIKHGTSMDNEAKIDIRFDIQKDTLHFYIKNTKPEQPVVREVGGIGLANVKRRLDLLYPKQHTLKIKEEKISYTVDLSLKL